MEEARLSVLKADIKRQLGIIEQVYGKIHQRSEGYLTNVERMESLAYQLHNLYCAFEDLMELVAEAFENRIGESGTWHIRLLQRMTESIPDIRPALFSTEAFPLLDELRGFHHWFRHAYSYEVEPEKLAIVLGKATAFRKIYKADVQGFLQQLAE
ncbi:MAG: hypothetical protein O7E52_17875 [Candidatus Poribacteria bacterium]|nr:hypothetical protein [Candidatus Poribacteria bacterium]